MKIVKVLNNNLVISINSDGNEVILRGKGIGFGMKRGETINAERIERVFVPQSSKESLYFQELFLDIPLEVIKCCEMIIEIAPQYEIKLTDNIILPLCDHINTLIIRNREGIHLTNPMLWDIQRLYPREFKLGMKMVELIVKELNEQADENEAAFLAYHFVSNQLNRNGNADISFITKLIGEILSIIELSFQTILSKDNWNYQRFITHLKFFANRLMTNSQQESSEDEWFYTIRKKFPQVYTCVIKIAEHLHENYHYELNQEEMLYLMLHIEHIIRSI